MPKISFPINGNEIKFAPVNNINMGINSSYTLFDFGRLASQIDKEKKEIALAKHQTELFRAELAEQVAVIYYSILFYKKSIAIEDSIIHYFSENKAIAESRLKNGEGSIADVLNLDISIQQESNKIIDFQNQLERQKILLEYATGLNNISTDLFDFTVETINISDSISMVYNPLFWIYNDKIEIAKKEMNGIKKSQKPILSLMASAGVRNGYMPDVNEERFNYMGGVSLSLPLYGFGKLKKQISLQESYIKSSELSKNSFVQTNKKDIDQTLTDIRFIKEKISHTEVQIKNVTDVEKITASRYQNGVSGFLDLNAAAANVQRTLNAQLQNEYQLCIANITLAKQMGFVYWK